MTNSQSLISWAFHLLYPPFLLVLLTTLVLASIGKSLGIRRLYVKTLIRVFEFAGKLQAGSGSQADNDKGGGGGFQVGGSDSDESGHESDTNNSSEDQTDNSKQKSCKLFKSNCGDKGGITGTTEEEV